MTLIDSLIRANRTADQLAAMSEKQLLEELTARREGTRIDHRFTTAQVRQELQTRQEMPYCV